MSYGDKLFRYSLRLWIGCRMAIAGERLKFWAPSITESCMQAWWSRLLHNDRALRCNSADPEGLKVCTALLLIEIRCRSPPQPSQLAAMCRSSCNRQVSGQPAGCKVVAHVVMTSQKGLGIKHALVSDAGTMSYCAGETVRMIFKGT